jgi:hypothetical protein
MKTGLDALGTAEIVSGSANMKTELDAVESAKNESAKNDSVSLAENGSRSAKVENGTLRP